MSTVLQAKTKRWHLEIAKARIKRSVATNELEEVPADVPRCAGAQALHRAPRFFADEKDSTRGANRRANRRSALRRFDGGMNRHIKRSITNCTSRVRPEKSNAAAVLSRFAL
jgi:hypothetical protein